MTCGGGPVPPPQDWEAMVGLLLEEKGGVQLNDEEEALLIELMTCAVQRATGANPPAGRSRGRVSHHRAQPHESRAGLLRHSSSYLWLVIFPARFVQMLSNKEKRAMEEAKEALSSVLMVAMPDLISKVGYNRVNLLHSCQPGPLAQSVERGADNAKVESSSLSWTTFFFFLIALALWYPRLYSMAPRPRARLTWRAYRSSSSWSFTRNTDCRR